MPDASKMPARIWALPGATRGYWSPTPSKHPGSAKVAYIRADIAEQMAEALRGVLGCAHSTTPEMTHALVNADAALSAWEASNA